MIDSYENEQEEKMFDHLERKEAMEEKMINTKELVRETVVHSIYRCLALMHNS